MSETVTAQIVAGDQERIDSATATHPDSVPTVVGTTKFAAPVDNHPSRTLVRLPSSYYDAFLSQAAKDRKPSPIRGLLPLENTPGMISFLAGKPNASMFPFTSFSFSARSPSNPSQEMVLKIEGDELEEALQYGPTAGLPSLCEWVYGLQERFHGRQKGEGWGVTVGSGSQDLIYKALCAMVNRGDAVLVESPLYAGVIPIFQSLHCEQIEVATDSEGISSESLSSILRTWPEGKPRPKILYTVPYGCNPTGMSASLQRRKDVLKLAQEYDFIILEDDPYFYLYYGEEARYPSYFALELQESVVGRVLRFDTMSKVMSAGMRVGFASGPEPLLQAIDRHTSNTNLQSSFLAQAATVSLLNAWGYDDFLLHTQQVSEFYRQKRDVFEQAMRRHMDGLAEWNTPKAGMFFWFKLLLTGPSGSASDDSKALIEEKALERGVLALPGEAFLPNGQKTAYVRAAFSLTPEDKVDEALRRLRMLVLDARGASN